MATQDLQNGHVVSGLDLSTEHAWVVARDLVELIHRGDEAGNTKIVRLDHHCRLVGAV